MATAKKVAPKKTVKKVVKKVVKKPASHLTKSEQKQFHVVVAVYTIVVFSLLFLTMAFVYYGL